MSQKNEAKSAQKKGTKDGCVSVFIFFSDITSAQKKAADDRKTVAEGKEIEKGIFERGDMDQEELVDIYLVVITNR